jgi:hypothetical protein
MKEACSLLSEDEDAARDLLEGIIEACSVGSCGLDQASPMVQLWCSAKYELAGILHDTGHGEEARGLYLDAIDGFSSQEDCQVAALNAKLGYALLLSEVDEMEAAIPLLREVHSGHRAASGANDPCTLRAAGAGMNLANALAETGDKADAKAREPSI